MVSHLYLQLRPIGRAELTNLIYLVSVHSCCYLYLTESYSVGENPPKDLNREECERLVITLMIYGIIKDKVLWTPYGACMYLQLGLSAQRFLSSSTASLTMYFPPRATTTSSSTKKRPPSVANQDGWLSTDKKWRISSSENGSSSSSKKKGSLGSSTKAAPPKRKSMQNRKRENEVIEIDLGDEEEQDGSRRQLAGVAKKQKVDLFEDSDDSNFEFE